MQAFCALREYCITTNRNSINALLSIPIKKGEHSHGIDAGVSCCKMHRLATTHSEKLNRQNFRVWNSHEKHDHLTMAIPDVAFSAVRFRNYIVRFTQYDWPS